MGLLLSGSSEYGQDEYAVLFETDKGILIAGAADATFAEILR
jgi:hypothetical protein